MDFEGFDGSDCLLCFMKKQFLGYFLCSYLLFGFVGRVCFALIVNMDRVFASSSFFWIGPSFCFLTFLF